MFDDQYEEMGSKDPTPNIAKWVLISVLILGVLAVGVYAYNVDNPFGFLTRWSVAGITDIKTLPATDAGTNYVTLNGNITGINPLNAVVWFEYGKNSNSYMYRTTNQTKTSTNNFSQKVEGIQLIPNTMYYFRAAGNDIEHKTTSYGEDLNFTTDALTPFEDRNFGRNYDELKEGKFNMSTLAVVLPKTYTDMMLQSNIFFGLFFGLIFMALWIRSEDVLLPSLLGMSVGAAIFVFLPPTWMKLAQSLFIVALACCIYSLIKGRK